MGKKVSNYVNSIINQYAALKDKESAFMFRDVIEVNMQILIIEFFLSVLLPEILWQTQKIIQMMMWRSWVFPS